MKSPRSRRKRINPRIEPTSFAPLGSQLAHPKSTMAAPRNPK
jgi:hypothetical protein